jgi:hypothetical protein
VVPPARRVPRWQSSTTGTVDTVTGDEIDPLGDAARRPVRHVPQKAAVGSAARSSGYVFACNGGVGLCRPPGAASRAASSIIIASRILPRSKRTEVAASAGVNPYKSVR